ncbi:ClpX C4-type zinc finger protein [Yersinia enterocolitica]|uniref:ClpX C4-type zinc finger protein n=1 Tax=Yersinia enterocolitica TaxID=630 RepID=UPI0005E9CA9A|nr:ATP-dependent protease ATP-binding subunit ClpX [Yersinia enterocolitica]CRY30158.1 ATP-dependent protease ATP-binding subunit ClpX [Yersinia enterocolitica]HDL6510792.1 ClpX C4-type zinc finger protein [Yersinia enterocolitica]HDL7708973.1 ClpX C4-type zinc finger protein [Yersinia enterocolitica]HDL7733872.1 ClpX C4-type zinc finger protein [Yersinia enterocolitica]
MSINNVDSKGNAKVFCSFCEKPSEELTFLVASKFAAICSDCIALSVKIIADKANKNTAAKSEIVNLGDREILPGLLTVRFENAPRSGASQ